jgi:hypothetical protein
MNFYYSISSMYMLLIVSKFGLKCIVNFILHILALVISILFQKVKEQLHIQYFISSTFEYLSKKKSKNC